MHIFYRSGNNLYVNITNKCPCDCIFCIRKSQDGCYDAESLWLEKEPSLDEIKAAFDARRDINEIEEIVFCGFGEPFERAETVFAAARYFRKCGAKIRINTNGLARLINPAFDISRLSEVDSISVSLNADDAEEYLRVTRPRFGISSYDEMLSFVADAKKFTAVTLSVVGILEPQRTENCRIIAANLGLPLRVR
jgi:TatD family-associated radical SAM protein